MDPVIGSAPFPDTGAEEYRQVVDERDNSAARAWMRNLAGAPAPDAGTVAPAAKPDAELRRRAHPPRGEPTPAGASSTRPSQDGNAAARQLLDFLSKATAPKSDAGAAPTASAPGVTEQPVAPAGLIAPGNLKDLMNRPQLKNADGSISTTRSMSFEEDGKEILVPTVVDGKQLTDEEAIARYQATGEHLGIFKDAAAADAYAQQLHEQQAKALGLPPGEHGDFSPPTADTAGVNATIDVGAIANDVVQGLRPTKLGPQILGGAIDMANETMKALDAVTVALGGPTGPPLQFPTTAPPDTATGGFIRTTVHFVAAFLPAAKVLKGLGLAGGLLNTATASGIAGAVAFDPHEERLSTYLNQVPALAGIVPDYLADNDPTHESDWEGRMKNAIDMAGGGLITDVAFKGLMATFKYYKLQRQARAALPKPPDQMAEQAAKDAATEAAQADLVAPVGSKELVGMGSPDAPLVVEAPINETAQRSFERVNAARDRAAITGPLNVVTDALDGFRATRLGQEAIGAGRDPLDDLIDQVRTGAAMPKMQGKPALAMLKGLGGVRVGSPLAAELQHAGVNSRTYPGLFRKTGGLSAADNIPASEHPAFENSAGADGYIPEDDIIAAVRDELSGSPRRSTAEQELIDTVSGPVKQFDEALATLGIDVNAMDNEAVKARLQSHIDEEARLAEMERASAAPVPLRTLETIDQQLATLETSATPPPAADGTPPPKAIFADVTDDAALQRIDAAVSVLRDEQAKIASGDNASLDKINQAVAALKGEVVDGPDLSRIDDAVAALREEADPSFQRLQNEPPPGEVVVPIGKEPMPVLFHGTAQARDKIIAPTGLDEYGPGAYLTSVNEIATRHAARDAADGKGVVYQVKVDATPDQFISWDVPLTDRWQSPRVMAELRRIYGDNPPKSANGLFAKALAAKTKQLLASTEVVGMKFRDKSIGTPGQIMRSYGRPGYTVWREELLSKVEGNGGAVQSVQGGAAGEGATAVPGVPSGSTANGAGNATGRAGASAADVSRETVPKGRIYINLLRINAADDVKAVLQQVANSDAEAIDIARRGVVTNAETIKEARQAFTDVEDLIGRKPGPMSAAEAVAARKVLTASGEQLVALAERARLPSATPADLFAFRRAMSVHYAIQSQVIAARTETARALQSWAIPAGSDKARADMIAQFITADGGSGEIQKIAQALASLKGNPAGVQAMVRQGMAGTIKSALFEVWINGILSSPKTHMVNITSNTLTSLWAIPERMLAAGISKAFYEGEVSMGEAGALAYGWSRGARDGVAMLAKGAGAENDPNLLALFNAFGKVESSGTTRAISPTAFGVDPASAFGMGIDYLGRVINSPTAGLRAEDTIFKAIGYRQQLNALAYRKAVSEGLEGRALADRVVSIIADPPPDLHAEAIEFAHYQTFTNKLGPMGRTWMAALNRTPGGRVVVPFISTPTNIMKFTFQRTPLALMSASTRADIRAGGARGAQAWARIGAGSLLMMTMADLAAEGVITGNGPADPQLNAAWRRQDNRAPYSIHIGDRWYSYNRLDPIGMMIGLAADTTEIIQQGQTEDSDRLVAAGVVALAQNLSNKTYMRGISEFVSAIDPSNPTANPGSYIADFSGSLVPFSSFLRNTAQATDPYLRDPRTTAEDPFAQQYLGGLPAPVSEYLTTLVNKGRQDIPGLDKSLPYRLDLWGERITTASGFGYAYDLLSPIASRLEKPSPIDKMIFDNQIRLSMPQRSIEGVKLTGEEYNHFVELAGKPAKAYLDQLIASPGFAVLSGGPEGMKAQIINQTIQRFRDAARGTMKATDEQFRQRWLSQSQDKVKLLTNEGAQ